MARTFTASPARREQVPLLIGVMGPSGGGKTFSALRLATGVQRVVGGDIYGIDTEAGRMKHYADRFRFHHVPFGTPFGSRDYLEALRWSVAQGAKTVVVDSMSHEHAGEGGYLDTHAREVERMSRGDAAKAERVKMAGWIKPAGDRQALINGILQLNANLIFCFRAKEKTKPKAGGGVQELGFMPIAGEEFVFEMTLNALLMPHAGGVPTWRSDQVGEKLMMKLPEQFRELFRDGRPLDEGHGEALAKWAQGDSAEQEPRQRPPAPRAPDTPPEAEEPAQRAPTLAERVEAAKGALDQAQTPTALDRTWTGPRMSSLRDELNAQEQWGLVGALEAHHRARAASLDPVS